MVYLTVMEPYKSLTIQKSLGHNVKVPLRGFFNVQVDMPPHRQEFTEVVFILHHTAEHYTEPGGWSPVRRGDIWIIPPGGIHGFRGTNGELMLFNLLFAADGLPAPMLDLYVHPGYKNLFFRQAEEGLTAPYPHLKLKAKQTAEMEVLLKQYVRYSKNLVAQYGIFLTIIGLLCEIAIQEKRDVQPPLDIQKVQRYFSENFASDITIGDLCRLTAMSPSSLQRHFRRVFGTTPAVYLREFRLAAACRLLLNSTRSVKEISALTGFRDPGYFIRIFRRTYHFSPGKYRQIK